MQNNSQYIEKDKIDLNELFSVLKRRRKLIWLITALFTLLALAYVFIAKPIYEVKALVELAQINKKPVHPTETLKKKIETVFEINVRGKEIKLPIISNVTIPKKTDNILIIKAQGHNNDSAKEKLQEVVTYLTDEQDKELDEYKKTQTNRLELIHEDIIHNKLFIENARTDISHYESKLLNISKQDASLAAIYTIEIGKKQNELNIALNRIYTFKNKKNDIESSLSPEKLQKTAIIGNIEILEKPIWPKKKLIVIVAFISALMLSVFLAFFLEFLQGAKKEEDSA